CAGLWFGSGFDYW
nr:immunoglobulin heavy chain junction region [Macaca mulatta]MOV50276.1 immunoglobulin heavy chain junction region [Macaca mulatta]MOV51708.1 immunoglobulin heavy chain junction region [Macaca mulatta]MOV52519.1 immunoglobulin heavy chain junction region [Macaca mulatta]